MKSSQGLTLAFALLSAAMFLVNCFYVWHMAGLYDRLHDAKGKQARTPTPPVVEVKCSECDGAGKVTYGRDHPIVKMGFDAGTYDCPMCGGSGTLYGG